MVNDQIVKALEKASGVKNPQIEFPENEAFGDYSSNIAMQMTQKGESGNFLENIEWFWKNIKKNNFSKYYDTSLPVGKLKNSPIYLRGSTFAKIRGFRKEFEGHPEITRGYFRAFPYVLFNPEHLIRIEKYEARYLLVGHLDKQFAVVVEVDFNKIQGFIVSSFMVKDRYLQSREGSCEKHKKVGKPAGTAIPPILAPIRWHKAISRGGGSRFSTLQDTQEFYSKLEAKSQGLFSLDYEIKRSPRELAEEIVEKINSGAGLPAVAEMKAGFINFWLKKDILLSNLIEIDSQKEDFGKSDIGQNKTVVIDYSAPNIAKPFGIGHLRSTVIGQAIYNLYKYLGYTVIGDNHLGDWGTQFGKLLYMIDKTKTKDLSIENLEKMYVEFHNLAKDDPTLEIHARAWFKKLEDNDINARTTWKQCVNVSLNEFQKIYDLLEVKIDNTFGESFYLEGMKDMLIEPKINKFLTNGEDGDSKVINLEKMGIKTPLMFLKSDGATTYATRDMATLQFRQKKYNPDIIIYEVGAEQKLYFEQLFASARLMELVKKSVELVHTAHGLYLDVDGKKFSTRKGKTIKLDEVLLEAIERAKKLGNNNQEIATQVGIGAIKYFDLMHSVQSNVVFDWEKMFAMEGNSSPYIQYTIARCNSLIEKAPTFKGVTLQGITLTSNEQELSILRKLSQFQEIIINAAKNYSPNVLCNYLYELAQKYNTFYNKHKIIGSSNEVFRLELTSGVSQVLKNGLNLLGIQAPERM
ncbi:MAG: arginine--tRNA ligase [Patescibacteria group bacterium]